MSLRVWLPLNGDLRNQGSANVETINSGATINNQGKIGKCYSFNGSSNKIVSTFSTAVNSSVGSLCCWLKMNSLPSSSSFYNLIQLGNLGGYATCRLGLYMEYNTRINISIDGSSTNQNVYTHSLIANHWYHICATFNGTVVKLYIDGEEVLSKTATVGSYKTNSSYLYIGGTSSYYLNGYLNDVRVYDHVLSEQEVKKIAQGLILHYPLNNRGMGQENLLKRTPKSYSPGSYCGYQLNFVENLEANQPYTLQLWDIDVSHSAKTAAQTGLSFYWGGGSVNLFSFTGTSYFTDGHADYLMKTFTPTQTQAAHSNAKNAWFNVYNSVPGVEGTRNMSIGAWKLEKGNIATPFAFSSIDTEYTKYKLNDNNVKDISGYQRNGTKIGTFSYNSDTSIYHVSSYFNGEDSAIQVPFDTTIWQDNFTINLWFKKDELGNKSYETLFGGPSGFEMDTRSGGSTTLSLYMASTRGGSVYTPFIFGIWYMVTLVNDGVNELYYINGELVKTIEKKSMPSGNYFIGAWQTAIKQNFKGQMSDFRIYATALSADDIKELYEYRS